jgi:hypothetical protein
MLGKHYLCAVVTQDAANWPTPNAQVSQDGESPETWLKRKEAMKAKGYNGNGCGTPLTIAVQLHGQAAPASSNTSGSRQGLWPTVSVPNGGQTTSGRADKDTKKQVRLEHAVAQWGTPAANDANKQNVMCEVNSKQAGLPKSVGLELQRPWMTPNARDWKGAHGEHFGDRARTQSLNNQMEAIGNKGAKLNPRWVETLMGLPIGWTMPSCASPQTIALTSCDSSAMELCLPPQSELSEFSLAS